MIWNQPFLREPIVPLPRPIESTRLSDLGIISGAFVLLVACFYCALVCCSAVILVPLLLLRRVWDSCCSFLSPPPGPSSKSCLIAALSLPALLCAQSLEWDANPSSERVVAYRIHAGTSSRVYSTNWTTPTNRFTLPPSCPPFVTVTALDTNGLESAYAAELLLLPTPPVSLRARYATNFILDVRAAFIVTASTTNWTPIATIHVTNATAPRSFFTAQPTLPKAKAAPAPPRP